MRKKQTIGLLACLLVLSLCAACQSPAVTMPTARPTTQATLAPTATAVQTGGSQEPGSATAATPPAPTATSAPATTQAATSAAPGEYSWDVAQAVTIVLNGNSIFAEGSGVTANGTQATITAAGTYVIRGSLADGQILVDAGGKAVVTLVLDGANIHSSTSAPVCVMNADEVVVVLADNTENYLSDGESYILPDPADDEPNAALFSKDDLTISGGGSLTVDAHYNDGIASKDGLTIAGGTITVNAVDDGIRGKDYLLVKDGNITVTAQGDGLKADEEEDAGKGYISVERGAIRVTCGGDAFQAVTVITISNGQFVLTAGGGSNARIAADLSAKGIKAGINLTINGGTFEIDSADDALHCNDTLVINGGTFTIATGDDALHADAKLEVNGGDFTITTSYEGLESSDITINDGVIYIASSDDGINAVAGNDGSGTQLPQGPGARPGRGGGPGQDGFAGSGNNYLRIHGGYVFIDADGDGLDINGGIEMSDGLVIVNGPTQNMNGALDYYSAFDITGGFLVAVGSAGMAQAPSQTSTQHSVQLNFNGTVQAGALLHVQSSDGTPILTFSSTKRYQSVVFSTAELRSGVTYDVYYEGSSTGTASDGLYQGGTYTPGTLLGSFTTSGIVTRLGSGRR